MFNIEKEQYEIARQIFDILDNDIVIRELTELRTYKINPIADFNDTHRSYNLSYGLPYFCWFDIVFYKNLEDHLPSEYKYLLLVHDFTIKKEFNNKKEFVMFNSSYERLLSAVRVLLDICWENKR